MKLTLDALIDRALELEAIEENDKREYIGASWIGDTCDRKLWMSYRWAIAQPFIGRILKRFLTGHHYEARVIAYLKKVGFEVHHINPRAKNEKKQYRAEWNGGVVSGGLDGFLRGKPADKYLKAGDNFSDLVFDRWTGVEIKGMVSAKYEYPKVVLPGDDKWLPIGNRREKEARKKTLVRMEGRYWKTKRLGVEKAQTPHFAQMHTYMGLSRERISAKDQRFHYEAWGLDAPLDQFLYIIANTDTDQLHYEIVEYRPAWYRRVKQRAMQIVKATVPPERISDNPLFWECEICDYRNICHGDQPMAPTCRSCQYAEIKVPGDRGYYGARVQWLCTEHGSGCGDYTACSDYNAIEDELVSF